MHEFRGSRVPDDCDFVDYCAGFGLGDLAQHAVYRADDGFHHDDDDSDDDDSPDAYDEFDDVY